jgi:hypothetical protein
MLALVAAVEAVQARREAGRDRDLSIASWEFAARAAVTWAVGSEVLGFGDSLIKCGLDPAGFGAASGRPARAYNLAAFGGPPALSYFLLRRALGAGARPRIVVVGYELANTCTPARPLLEVWQRVGNPAEAVDLAVTYRDPGLFGAILAGRLLPSVRNRRVIRGEVRQALDGEDRLTVAAPNAEADLWDRNCGVCRLSTDRHLRDETAAGNLRHEASLRDINPVQKRYIRRFLDLAAARGIRVVWLLPPADPESLAIWGESGVFDRYPALLGRLLVGRRHVVLVDARDAGYLRSAFHDLVHLNRRGAEAFSAELADLLRWFDASAWPDAPGLVTLATVRGTRTLTGARTGPPPRR